MNRRNLLITIFGLVALVAIFVIAINLAGGGTPLNADTINRDIIDASMNPVIGSNVSGTVSGSNFSGTGNVSFTLQGPSNLTLTNISFQWRWYSNSSNNFTAANGTGQDLVANRTIFNDSIASLNSLAENDTLWNYTFDTTTLPDGVYNVTILVYNFSGGIAELPFANQSFMTFVTVDNTKPIVNITVPKQLPTPVVVNVANGDTYNISFNVTVFDVLSGVKTVTFQFSNGSSHGGTLFNRTATNWSHFLPNATYGSVYSSMFVTWEVLVNSSSLAHENPITVTVYAQDFAGNLNKTQTFSIFVNINGGGTPLSSNFVSADIIESSMNPVIGSNASGIVSGSNFSGTVNVSFALGGPSNLTLTNVSFQWRWYSNTSNNFTVANGTRQDLVQNKTIFNDSINYFNSLARNDTLWNYTFDTTTFPDGVYNVTILVYNFSGGIAELPFANQSFMTFVTVDNTIPVVNVTIPKKWPSQVAVEVSADDVHNLSFNVTARDALSGVKNVTFQFSNGSTAGSFFNVTATNRSHFLPNATYGDVYGSLFVTWEVLVNASSLSDENPMTVTVFTTDFAGNLNKTETFTINVDKTAPTLTMTLKEGTETSLEITVATSSDAKTCTTTLGTITGTGSTRTITATDLSPATSYSFTVRCSDEVDNSKSLTSSFTTESPSGSAAGAGSGGGGSGGPSRAARSTTTPTAVTPEAAVVVMDFVVNRATPVAVGEVSHTVTVVSATAQRVTVTISSEPVTITLDAGESKEIDTDGDGKNDLRVRYVALVSGKPKLELTSLATVAVPASGQPTAAPAVAEPVAVETTKQPSQEEGRSLSWIIILVVIVAAAVAYFGLRKKR
ncbi:MAG TPA: Ig-like domain-containing protein [Candidatus Nanoarchaeia archaeon]|nr:Ig-like domain-containing protein [Candidatus Nanoarchaeia archaeon]